MQDPPSDTLIPDLCVIGAGSAGLSVTAIARAFGASVVLVEEGEMGGDCLNTGCVPSKSLIAAAHFAAMARAAPHFGVQLGGPKIDFARVQDHIAQTIAQIAPHDSQERFEQLGATVVRARGRFTDPRTLVAGDVRIRARRFVIATGARPAIPAIKGLDQVPTLTNETLFALRQCPDHLAILGGGPVGMEMAQSFIRLGARVTLVEQAAPLAGQDPAHAKIVQAALVEEGVRFLAPARVTAVSGSPGALTLSVAGQGEMKKITASHLLCATGRQPALAGLGLNAAGVTHSATGIGVDARLRTSNRRIFAIGDVTGGRQFTHVANYQAGLVIRSALFGLPVRQKSTVLPWCIYTDPELAGIGLSELEARQRYGKKLRVLKAPFAQNDRARTQNVRQGEVKLLAGPRGRLLGASIVGPHAGELIALLSFAMARGARMSHLAGFVAPYPTLAEAIKRAAVDYYAETASSPLLRAWLAFIRLFP